MDLAWTVAGVMYVGSRGSLPVVGPATRRSTNWLNHGTAGISLPVARSPASLQIEYRASCSSCVMVCHGTRSDSEPERFDSL